MSVSIGEYLTRGSATSEEIQAATKLTQTAESSSSAFQASARQAAPALQSFYSRDPRSIFQRLEAGRAYTHKLFQTLEGRDLGSRLQPKKAKLRLMIIFSMKELDPKCPITVNN